MNTVIALTALALWTVPTSDDKLEGRATYYAPHLMETAAYNRGITIPPGVIPIALNRYGDLRRRVWLRWGDRTVQEAISVDCAAKLHYRARENSRLVVEVSAEVAQQRGFYGVGPVGVTVLFENPYPETRVIN